jgi:hypothetical protein
MHTIHAAIGSHTMFPTLAATTSTVMTHCYPEHASTIATPGQVIDALLYMAEHEPIAHGLSEAERDCLGDYATALSRGGDRADKAAYAAAQYLEIITVRLPRGFKRPFTRDVILAAIVADPRWADIAPRLAAFLTTFGEKFDATDDPDEVFVELYFIGERSCDDGAYDEAPYDEEYSDRLDTAVCLRLDGGYSSSYVAHWYEMAEQYLPAVR